MTSIVAVVDYGMGNLRSVAKALEYAAAGAARVVITSEEKIITSADKVVVPGQGAARDCMNQLRHYELVPSVLQAAKEKPFLGICMGLQVLFEYSDENQNISCLGLFAGGVHAFPRSTLKVPHMGWNQVRQLRPHPLFAGITNDARFYFVHSYFVQPKDKSLPVASTEYGKEFTAAIAKENVFACQFHPEKSAADGLRLLQNFMRWQGEI